MIANYHSHSRWCRHGVGEIEDYIVKAISLGFTEMAITEHVPQPVGFSWIPYEELAQYDQTFNEAIRKYSGQIKIYKGFECEYVKSSLDYYKRLQEEMGYTFLIHGQHESGEQRQVNSFALKTRDEAKVYCEYVCDGIASGMFKLLCHPDVILCSYPGLWDANLEEIFHTIFKTCEEYHMPVEVNASGLREERGYPSKLVYDIARKYDLRFILNADAHHPEHLYDEVIQHAERMVKDWGIKVEPIYPRELL